MSRVPPRFIVLFLCVFAFGACSSKEHGEDFWAQLQYPLGPKLAPGKTQELELQIVRNGYEGPLTVTFSGLPEPLLATALEVPAGATKTRLTLTLPGSLPAGTPVTGEVVLTGGGLTRTVPLPVLIEEAGGTLDRSFGQQGKVEVESVEDNLGTCALAATPSGELLTVRAHRTQYVLERRGPEGDLRSTLAVPSADHVGLLPGVAGVRCGLTVKPDGTVLLAGTGKAPLSGVRELFVRQYRPDGTVEAGFGQEGTAHLPLGASPSEGSSLELFAFQPLDDGRLLVAGVDGGDALVARLTPTGALDLAFGQDGVARIPHDSVATLVQRLPYLVLRPDGRLWVTSFEIPVGPDGYPHPAAVVHGLRSDGQVDTTLGVAGRRSVDLFGIVAPDGVMAAPVPVADGKLLLVFTAHAHPESTSRQRGVGLMRLTSTGTLDTTFGYSHGTVWVPSPLSRESFYLSFTGPGLVTALPDGRLFVAGWFRDESAPAGHHLAGLYRIHPDGTLAPVSMESLHYGSEIMRIVPSGQEPIRAVRGMVLLPDGRVLVASDLGQFTANGDRLDAQVRLGFHLARFFP